MKGKLLMVPHVYSLDELKEAIKPIAQRYNLLRVYLFGSYARGEAGLKSDVDLRIDFEEPYGYFTFFTIQTDLEDSLMKHVDLVTAGGLDSDFLERIKEEEILLYENCG
jgi:predicted nucleotidyltransferase